MRWIYVLIVVFLAACAFLTRWYLCDIRGLCAMPADQFAADRTVAIVEILLALLTAFLIGFGVAWLLQSPAVQAVTHHNHRIVGEFRAVQSQMITLERENQGLRKNLQEQHLQVAHHQKTTEELNESIRQVGSLNEDLRQAQRRYDNLKQEFDELREKTSALRDELDKFRESQKEPGISTMENIPTEKKEDRALREGSRFTPASWQTRDDLTRISGIGPVIQRKLNEQGIYSFQQISELSDDQIQKISKAIRFFPDRIQRDNWIGQAVALVRRHQLPPA